MKFVDGVTIEVVGRDIVALTPGGEAVRLSGDVAESVRRMLNGSSELTPADVELLSGSGLVEPATGGVTRRTLVLGSAAVAGGGVVALSLPVAAVASSRETDIWGDYGAVPAALTEAAGLPRIEDYLDVWVYVAQDLYDEARPRGQYSETASWPSHLDATDSWRLLFGNSSVDLGVRYEGNATDGPIQALAYTAYKEDPAWNQALFDFLKDDWAAEKTISLSITNGQVTVPVSLFAWPWVEEVPT
jgi:hypothetical protein